MKKILLIASLVLLNISVFTQTVTVGTGTSVWSSPFEMSWGYFRYAYVYQSSEIITTGNINSMGWYIESLVAPAANGPVKIYLKTISNPFIGGEIWSDITTDATLVYDDNAVFVAGGWQTFNLTAPFNYTGDHLLVMVETNYGGAGSGEFYTDKNIRYSEVSAGMGEVWHQDNTPPTGVADYTTTKRPNIQLNFDISTAMDEEIATSSYATLNIAPNPANQTINYSVEGVEEASLSIYNMAGILVYSEQISANQTGIIDISLLPKGCYMVGVLNDNVNLIKKLLIQ